jgi:dipeptidyl-peptidase-4
MKRSLLLILTVVVFAAQAQKQITVEDFTTKNTFAQKSVTGINWMKDGQFYSSLSSNKIIKFDITTGKEVQTLLDGDALL